VTKRPTGTVTFVFTDIEGSTRLAQRLGDRWHSVLDRHHDVLRSVFAAARGIEVGTEGDAFFVVFERAGDAVTAVADAQRALAKISWGDGVSLRVRMGLHAGVAETAGDNYAGIDVHRAARIASAAHGGQVLMSAATARLAEQWLPAGVRTKDLGEFKLKDLDRPEHLFQLCVDDLPSDFPPPRTAAARPTNLPTALTAFVGREREREEVVAMLETNRLVTLTGPGGTGKTRLALAVGEAALASFHDGTYFVPLAPLEDPVLVASTIAQTLELREYGAVPILDTLKDYLANKEMLLILDNFEQVVDAAPIVPELLQAAPRVTVVVTSRTPLRVRGEQEYEVPPMSMPLSGREEPLSSLLRYEAIDLFVQSARRTLPSFSVTTDNAGVVAEICRRLDGLPLAIELAAARLRLMPPEQILARLDAALSFLRSSARDLPARQRTLRDAIRWSFDLLDPSQRTFFSRLGVFVGGCDLPAVDYVTQANVDLDLDPLDAVEAMLDSSLLRRSGHDGSAVRFRMLETVREFALDQLRKGDEEEQIRGRHAQWFLRLVEETAPRFTTGPDALEATEVEHDNVRAALRWMIDSGDAESAMRLGAAMWRFWQLRSHLAEGRRWLSEIVEMAPASEPTLSRGRAVMALGSLAYWQNDFTATLPLYQEALDILRAVGDASGIQEALYNVGFLSLLQRDPDTASKRFEASRHIAERLQDKRGLANTAWGLAMSALQAGDWSAARRWAEECQRLYDDLDDIFGRGLARFVFFQVARYTNSLSEARRMMVHTLLESDIRDGAAISSGLEMLAEVELLEERIDRAIKLRAASQAIRADYGGGSPPPLLDLSDVKEVAGRSLDQETIDRLWEQGRSLTPTEARELALSITEGEQIDLHA
jgi:predicted ATPase/class 3 adenylate cyclase